jgi:hypothetical protein
MIMVTVAMLRTRTWKQKGKTLNKNSESVKHPPLVYVASITLYIVSTVKYICVVNNCIYLPNYCTCKCHDPLSLET